MVKINFFQFLSAVLSSPPCPPLFPFVSYINNRKGLRPMQPFFPPLFFFTLSFTKKWSLDKRRVQQPARTPLSQQSPAPIQFAFGECYWSFLPSFQLQPVKSSTRVFVVIRVALCCVTASNYVRPMGLFPENLHVEPLELLWRTGGLALFLLGRLRRCKTRY